MVSFFKAVVIVSAVVIGGCSDQEAAAPDQMTGSAVEPAAASVETIATFPPGTFLENIDRHPDGSLLVTSYFDKKLLRVTEEGDVTTFAALADHPVGVLVTDENIVLSMHGASFADGPGFMETNSIAILTHDGETAIQTAAPDAKFLNGLHQLPSGDIVVADSIAGVIWSVAAETGEIDLWAEGEILTIDGDDANFVPGANGIKSQGGDLFVSNSSRGTIYRRPIEGGAFALHAETGGVDDFVIDDDGTIYATSHGASLLRVGPDGAVSNVISEGCDGCTSVVFSADGDGLIEANTGDVLAGNPKDTRIFVVKNFAD